MDETIGTLIRDLRLAHGWSQARLADELCSSGGATVTREDISRWEHGRRTPGGHWLRHLAAVLETDIRVLEGAVRRRSFLTTVAAGAIAPAVADDLLRHGFTAALDRTHPSLDDWADRVDTYGRDYMTEGAAEIQRRLAGDLVVLQQQLETPGMWAVAARMMTMFGKTIPGADGAAAVRWYRTAATAADRGEDTATRVWVRGRAAIALGYEGACLPLAARFADQALAIDDTPSLGRLNAVMGRAHVAAAQGDEDTARNLVDEGRRVFDHAASPDGEISGAAVPPWRMAVFESLLFARLGDEKRAERAHTEATRSLPSTLPRFRTHLDLHRALLLARSGDHATGLHAARTAMAALPAEKQSITLRLLVDEIETAARV